MEIVLVPVGVLFSLKPI